MLVMEVCNFFSSLIAFQFLSYSGTHIDALVILDLQEAMVEVWMDASRNSLIGFTHIYDP